MPIILETERLLMKQFSHDDAHYLFELNSDPEVIKYVGETAYNNIGEVYEFIRHYNQYEKYGTGRLNMFEQQTCEYIGWCGLKRLANHKIDLGYRLLKRQWGKGYATEVSVASLNYGFGTLGLERIIATAMKANTASINIFNKLGFKYSHDDHCHNEPAVVYTISQEEWK